MSPLFVVSIIDILISPDQMQLMMVKFPPSQIFSNSWSNLCVGRDIFFTNILMHSLMRGHCPHCCLHVVGCGGVVPFFFFFFFFWMSSYMSGDDLRLKFVLQYTLTKFLDSHKWV